MKIYTLNAFAATEQGGNPAGVVLNAENISEKTMLKMAKTVGFSETAFVQNSKKAHFKIKFFTPKEEIDLCGHATIATISLMTQKSILKPGQYSQETKAGVLGIKIQKGGLVYMNQNLPKYFEEVPKKEIAKVLKINEEEISPNLPTIIMSTGVKEIFVPILKLKTIQIMQPNFKAIKDLSKKYNVIGLHVFSLKTIGNGNQAHCRNFAPLVGIDEDPATGTSSGALCCYLYKFLNVNPKTFVFEQGYEIERPSKILGKLVVDKGKIKTVQIGGKAIITGERRFNLNNLY